MTNQLPTARPTFFATRVVFALGIAAALVASGCSDDPRIPQGEQFAMATLGTPGIVLIDDMEDGNQYILSDNGLNGLWYIYSDESPGSSQTPELGFPMTRNDGSVAPLRACGDPRGIVFTGETECAFFAHSSGDGQLGWGAGVGVDFNGDGGEKNAVDATQYAGIGFFARGNTRGGQLSVKVQDASTTPESLGAADALSIPHCLNPSDNSSGLPCADHFLYNITVTNEWQWYAIPWRTFASSTGFIYGFRDEGYNPNGFPNPGLHLEALVGLQFQVTGADPDDDGMIDPGVSAQPFDFSIDNVGFIEAFAPQPGASLVSTAAY